MSTELDSILWVGDLDKLLRNYFVCRPLYVFYTCSYYLDWGNIICRYGKILIRQGFHKTVVQKCTNLCMYVNSLCIFYTSQIWSWTVQDNWKPEYFTQVFSYLRLELNDDREIKLVLILLLYSCGDHHSWGHHHLSICCFCYGPGLCYKLVYQV